MKRWELERIIFESRVSDGSKIIGLVIVRHWSAKNDMARLRLGTIAEEIGKTNRTVIRGVNELIEAGIFVRVRTGRASILRLGEASKKSGEYTNSGSDILDTSDRHRKPIFPKTGTRFKEYCPRAESTEDSGEFYTKTWELTLGF